MSWNQPPQYDESLPSTNPFGNYTVVDTVPKAILHMVDKHWYQFPPMNPMWYGLLGFAITVLGLLSVFGNLIVIWVFMNTKSLRSPANMLVVCLACSDFMMMSCMFPPMVICCMYGTWVFSAMACQIYAFIGNLAGCVSIYTMCFITADRYNVIVKGMQAAPLTMGGAGARAAFAWIWSFIWCCFPFFGWNRYVPEGNMTACGTDYLSDDQLSKSYLYVYSCCVYVIPLLYIIFAYTHIVKAVANHERGMREQAKKMGVKSLRNEEAQKTSAECRLAKVALVTVSLWFMAWTPYLVINFAGMFNKSQVTPLFSIWGSLFAKANAVYNPIIYAISHPKYRAALNTKLPCLACTTAPDSGNDNSSAVSSTTVQEPEKKESQPEA